MNILKKQTAGSIITCLTFILGIVSFIIYEINIGGEGYFQGAAVPLGQTYMLLGISAALIVVVLGQLKLEGAAGLCLDIVSDVIRVLIPVLFIAAAMTIVGSRVEGFAFIYFSNEEVLHEVQTAANMSSAHSAIANIASLAVSAVVGILAAFFGMKKTK